MKCPKCGNELEDGKLLCTKCGEEINIVPDFDIELEDRLSESISSMMEDIADEENDKEDKPFEEDANDEFSDIFSKSISLHQFKIPLLILSVVAIVALGLVVYGNVTETNRYNSFDYQYSQAVENAAQGDYNQAVSYLERALAINSEDLDARFLLAKYYDKNGQRQSAISILEEILRNDAEYDKLNQVYDMLLDIYEQKAEYEKMAELLNECTITDIISKYNEYTAFVPEFSRQGGVYDEIMTVSISAQASGFVYYTLDGSVPTRNSAVYETPILLESGEYVIRAMFVNMYGIQSSLVSQNYYISLASPSAPIVRPDSGVYSAPTMIEAYYDDNSRIYYTTDGTVPTKYSTRYVGAIEMAYGVSNYSFVSIDESGLSSEVVNRTYQLSVDANFSTELAITVLKNNLWAIGKLSTVEGNVPDKLGLNQYSVATLYSLDGEMYYIVREEYVDMTGQAHETNNLYAINTNTADLYKAYKLDEGKYNLRPFDE